MNKPIKAKVGTLEEMGTRFVSAWHRLERREKVRERHSRSALAGITSASMKMPRP